MPNPKPASPWLIRTSTFFTAILFTMVSGTSLLATDPPRMEHSGVVGGDKLRPIRSSDSSAEQLLAMRLGAVATQQVTVPAGPPPGQRPMPQPGPCPLPILPALAAMEDTEVFTVRDVPHGTVESVSYTNHLGAQKRMHIYLPPGYVQDTTSRYPVLYLNHGGGDDDAKWTNTDPRNGGHAHTILDNLIADEKARPMIIVMPNTRGLASANPPPEDEDDACTQEYVKDIIPYVDRHFRTQASREGRALAGLSMAGFVVMHTGLSRLDTFSELYVFSSGHFPDGLPKFEERFRPLFEDAETNNKLRVPFYMAQGETDIALRNGQRVMAIINQYGLRNFWVLSSGGHEWANWRRYLHQTAQIMFPDCD